MPSLAKILRRAGTKTREYISQRRQQRPYHRAAKISSRMLWVSFFILLATVVYAWVSVQQWRAIDAANQLSKQIFVVGQRPLVAVEKATPTGITYDVNGLNMGIEFSLENTGNSPALRVETFFLLSVDLLSLHNDHLHWCNVMRLGKRPETRIPPSGIPVFPKVKAAPLPSTYPLSLEVIKKTSPALKFRLFAAGCVTYEPPFDDVAHQTAFMYLVRHDGDQQFDVQQGSIPAASITLTPEFSGVSLGDFWAD